MRPSSLVAEIEPDDLRPRFIAISERWPVCSREFGGVIENGQIAPYYAWKNDSSRGVIEGEPGSSNDQFLLLMHSRGETWAPYSFISEGVHLDDPENTIFQFVAMGVIPEFRITDCCSEPKEKIIVADWDPEMGTPSMEVIDKCGWERIGCNGNTVFYKFRQIS